MSRTVPHRRRRDADVEEVHGGGMERWLLTYSDMITLLLALFVMLFAVASVNKAKLEQLSQSIHHSLDSGGMSAGAGRVPAKLSASRPVPTTVVRAPATHTATHRASKASPLVAVEAQVRASLAAHGLLGDVAIETQPKDFVVRLLADTLFYATDSASLTPVGKRVVDATGAVLAEHRNPVVVRGYTDNTPVVGGPYFTNWELSAARSVEVVLRLVHVDRVNPGQVVAEGYGDTHPMAPNNTPADRARNRRVDIVVYARGAPPR